jgi:hypothetical protein
MIVGFGFEQLGLHRISLPVYAFNPAGTILRMTQWFLPLGRS